MDNHVTWDDIWDAAGRDAQDLIEDIDQAINNDNPAWIQDVVDNADDVEYGSNVDWTGLDDAA